MREVELEEIKQKAYKYHKAQLKWHFHILTPTCSLNNQKKYAFVLECPEKDEQLVYYSDQAERELGEELSPMLHGAKVFSKELAKGSFQPSTKIKHIIARAKALNEEGVEWHHHLLFPGCQFNTNSPKFTLIFEDPQTGGKIENVTAEEPVAELNLLEPLFYKK